jgi:hypothetical protein
VRDRLAAAHETGQACYRTPLISELAAPSGEGPTMPMITLVLEPPPKYVHPYHGPVIERVLPLAEARRACARMGTHADACSWVKRGTCHLVIPLGGPVSDLGAYRRHEMAHCNGWPASHPGGRVPAPYRNLMRAAP